MWNPPLIDEATERGARRSPRPPTCSPSWSPTACGRSASCDRARDRADPEASPGCASKQLRRAGAWRRGSRPTAPATRRSSGARSRPTSPAASCSPSSPPTRSSSASTSASSTRRSASPSRAPSPACARCGGGPGGGASGLAIYIAGQDALDQFFCRHPDEFLERPVEAAILDHANEQIQTAHLIAAAYEAPLGARPSRGADDEILGEGWRERADAPGRRGRLRAAPTAATCRAGRASRPARSRCARPRPTRSRSSTRPRAR